MEIPKNIFELIESPHFRKTPAMYLRGNRILDMVKFIDAYQICESHNNLDSGILDFFFKFMISVRSEMAREFPEQQHSNYHWYQMIEIIAKGDNDREIPIFFHLYDKYKNQ